MVFWQMIGRRVYDMRVYGSIRAELGQTQVRRATNKDISIVNARISMGRELVDFLEGTAPNVATGVVQILFSLVILYSFSGVLLASSFSAIFLMVLLYDLFDRRFFRLNKSLNEQHEQQVQSIQSRDPKQISAHFLGLRKFEVKISDTESFVYGLIFLVLLAMLAFNLWFAATGLGSSAGQIFSIVNYSYELIQAAVTVPMALQSWTRLSEITNRINSI